MRKVKKFFEGIISVKNKSYGMYKAKILTLFGKKLKIWEKLNLTDGECVMLRQYCRIKKLRAVNKEAVSSKIENMRRPGVLAAKEQRTPKLIVSLTSYPARMYDIHYCLYSLLSQTLKPDKVILWLGKEQFPEKEEEVPKKVKELERFGLEIKWTKDLKSYKKLIPALKEYTEDIIVTADDDIFYEPEWLEKLYGGYDGKTILCHRAHRITFEGRTIEPYRKWRKKIKGGGEASSLNFFTGCGGVLYPPNVLYEDVCKEELFNKLSPTADDLWFWSMAVLKGTKIKIVENNIDPITYINVEREVSINDDETLHKVNYNEGNDKSLLRLLDYYPEILKKLQY